jgi:hypothetical protein
MGRGDGAGITGRSKKDGFGGGEFSPETRRRVGFAYLLFLKLLRAVNVLCIQYTGAPGGTFYVKLFIFNTLNLPKRQLTIFILSRTMQSK